MVMVVEEEEEEKEEYLLVTQITDDDVRHWGMPIHVNAHVYGICACMVSM